MKINLAFDLLTGSIIFHSLQAATEQDKVIGKEFVIEVRLGDLVLRDMGYFSLSEFTAIELRGAWWLTRLPLTTGVMLADGRRSPGSANDQIRPPSRTRRFHPRTEARRKGQANP